MKVQAVIFDLDGVITDTARYHFQAWQALAEQLGIVLDEQDCEALKGLERITSLEFILAKGALVKSEQEKQRLAEQKNRHYQSLIATMGKNDLFPGVEAILNALRQQAISIGLASSSKNAALVLDKLQITDYFDYVVDANAITKGKPHPEIFLNAAQGLGLESKQCIGIEDAIAGVQAIRSAGMFAVGIGDAHYLTEADIVYSAITDMNLEEVFAC